MKALIANKDWRELKPSAKAVIQSIYEEQLNHDCMVIVDKILKMSCDALNRNKNIGLGETRLLYFISEFYSIFKEQFNNVKAGEQDKKLDERMKEIFKEHGYPDYFFKQIFSNWHINTRGESS